VFPKTRTFLARKPGVNRKMRWSQDKYEEYIVKRGRHPEDADKPDSGRESRLQAKCEKWLRDHGYYYVHDRSRKKNVAGIPDLICFLPEGRVVVVELKAKEGKPSKEQIHTLRMLKYHKHEVYVVRSYKKFLEIVHGT
jgi:phage terminase large subunit-like protein